MLSRLPAKCRECGVRFSPEERAKGNPLHPACIPAYADKRERSAVRKQTAAARKAAKAERAETAIRKAVARDKVPYWIKRADKAFAAYIRLRDQLAGLPCVSSGKPLNWNGNQVDAGHYRSRGAASHLRYHPDNCHAQSKRENMWRAGNAVEYRIRLIDRIGVERVEALECNNAVHQWEVDELKGIEATFKQLRKELEGQK